VSSDADASMARGIAPLPAHRRGRAASVVGESTDESYQYCRNERERRRCAAREDQDAAELPDCGDTHAGSGDPTPVMGDFRPRHPRMLEAFSCLIVSMLLSPPRDLAKRVAAVWRHSRLSRARTARGPDGQCGGRSLQIKLGGGASVARRIDADESFGAP